MIENNQINWDAFKDRFETFDFSETTVTPVDWNDDYFVRSFLPLARLERAPTAAESKTAAKAFLNWYIGDFVPAEPKDVFLTLFFSIKMADGRNLYSQTLIGGVNQLTQPGDVTKLVNMPYTPVIIASSKSRPGGSSQSGVVPSNQGAARGIKKEDVIAWYSHLYDSLEGHRSQETINLLGFLSMVCMRLFVKDSEVVSQYLYDKALETFKSLWGRSRVEVIYPPSKGFLADMGSAFKRFSGPSSTVLAAYVETIRSVPVADRDNVSGILKAGCLLSLQKIGLGILHWAQRAATETKTTICALMMYMATASHRTTNLYLIKFLNDVASHEDQKTWPWARLFQDGAFVELGIRRDPLYARVMMSLTIGCDSSSPMWDILSFSQTEGSHRLKRDALTISKAIAKDIRDLDLQSGETEGARRISRAITQAVHSDPHNVPSDDDSLECCFIMCILLIGSKVI